ncbi:MAG TPA: hypothetical protein VMD49_04030 [Steroidobacteraceae bacterium]|nr:hypothetical protein [Steroidobacteraceae bacterium]
MALPLLVLFAQQGALLHELSHVYYAGQASGRQLHQDEQLPDDSSCPTCQSFAQVAHPASGSAPVVVVPPAVDLPCPDPSYRIAAADAPRPRSRGPPQIRA